MRAILCTLKPPCRQSSGSHWRHGSNETCTADVLGSLFSSTMHNMLMMLSQKECSDKWSFLIWLTLVVQNSGIRHSQFQQVKKNFFGPVHCLPCARIISYHLINTIDACHVFVFNNTFQFYDFFSLSTVIFPVISFGSGTITICKYHCDYPFIHPRQYHDLAIVSGYYFIFSIFPGLLTSGGSSRFARRIPQCKLFSSNILLSSTALYRLSMNKLAHTHAPSQ